MLFERTWQRPPTQTELGGLIDGYVREEVHFVCVSDRADALTPDFAGIRESVRRAWDPARRTESNEKLYQSLPTRYHVTIEAPRMAEPGSAVLTGTTK